MKFSIGNLLWILHLYLFIINIDLLDRGFGTTKMPLLKYLPTVFCIVILAYYLILNLKKSALIRANWVIKSLFVFFILMLGGSVVSLSQYSYDLELTYTGRALNICSVFVAYFFVTRSSSKELYSFSSRIIRLYIFYGVVISILIYYLAVTNQLYGLYGNKSDALPFHEQVGLFIPISILALLYFEKNTGIKYLLFFLISTAGLLIWKNTSIIVLLITIVVPIFFLIEKRGINKYISRGILGIALFIALVIIPFYFIVIEKTTFLPSGNTVVRLVTYQQRINEFLSSPIYGSFFTGNPIIKIAWLRIPSHSDFLDILSIGGILSVLLFTIPVTVIVITAFNDLKKCAQLNNNFIYCFYLLLSAISWFTILSFNPILNQPNIIFFFWFSLGFILGIHQRRQFVLDF